MDYERMSHEFMTIMHRMKRRRAQKQINDSMQGENFVLFFISRHEGTVIPSDISNEMCISSARIAATLNALEAKGFITRRIDENDRRKIIIDLTEAGRVQAKDHYHMMLNETRSMLQYLGEEDSKEFIRIMKRLVERKPEEME